VGGERGTGPAAYYGRPAAGKTGTAENFQDAWFCGFVPQLVTCVWVGYPKAEIPMVGVEGYASVFGGSLPARIWHDFMSQATANLPVEYFSSPTIDGSIVSGSPVASYSYGPSSTGSTPTTSTPSSPLLSPMVPAPVRAATPVPPAPAAAAPAAPTPVQPA